MKEKTTTLAVTTRVHRAARYPRVALWAFGVAICLASVPQVSAQPSEFPPSREGLPVPDDLSSGDTYQLLFRSSMTTDGLSNDVAYYDAFVQLLADAAGIGVTAGVTWSAIASTEAIDAIEHALVEAPVYNLHYGGPERIADGFDDMWDGSVSPLGLRSFDENGDFDTGDVWTGSSRFGEGLPNRTLGHASGNAGCGNPVLPGDDWIEFLEPDTTTQLGVYGLSSVLTVP